MNVQIIDKQPRGTDTRFVVGSDVSSSNSLALLAADTIVVLDTNSMLIVADSPIYGQRVVSGWLTASSEAVQTQEDITSEFKRLADKWREDTEGYSSMVLMAAHDSYLRVIRMGWLAVPLILRDMRSGGGYWYKALRVITGENPVTEAMAGHIPQMNEAWLAWGRSRGFV